MEDEVGVGAGVAAAGFVLDGELGLGSDVDEPLDDVRVVRSAVGNGRAATELDAAVFGGIQAGGVGTKKRMRRNDVCGAATRVTAKRPSGRIGKFPGYTC